MTFPTDFVISQEQPSTFIHIEPVIPIVDNGSLIFSATDAPERSFVKKNTYTSGINTAGRIRSVFRIDSIVSSGDEEVGFSFMMNNASVRTPSDAGYAVLLTTGSDSFGLVNPRVIITKYAGGLAGVPAELASVSVPTVFGGPFVMEAEWVNDVPQFGGVVIKVRYANGTDFGTMTEVLSFTDTVSPIITSSHEGLVFNYHDLSGQFNVKVDETSVFQLT